MAAPFKTYSFGEVDKEKLRNLLLSSKKAWEDSYISIDDAEDKVERANEELEQLILQSVNKTVPFTYEKDKKPTTSKKLEENQLQLKKIFEEEGISNDNAFFRAINFLKEVVEMKPFIRKIVSPKGKVIQGQAEIAIYFNQLWSQLTQDDSKVLKIKAIAPSEFVEFELTTELIISRINLMPLNKAHAYFELRNEMVMLDPTAFAPYLLELYQLVLNSRRIPVDWRHSKVIPAYKGKGKDVTCEDSYRPISLSPPLGRLLEHLIADYLNNVLAELHLLHVRQHGHRKGFSNNTQLACLLEDLSLFTRAGSQVDCVKLDLKSATNFVSHRLLLDKLKCLPIDILVYDYIKGFLLGHTQTVKVGTAVSPLLKLQEGLPQGSPLTNPLFLIYTNAIFKVMKNKSRIRCFIDDILVYKEIKGPYDQDALQGDLDELMTYFKQHCQKVNLKKLEAITFCRPEMFKKGKILERAYHICSTKVTRVQHMEYLGMTLSSDLTAHQHVLTLLEKYVPTLDQYMQLVELCPSWFKSRLYLTVLRPKLEICSSIWGLRRNFSDDELFARLEREQQKWCAFALGTEYHSESWHPSWQTNRAKLGWESLHARRNFAQLHLAQKYFNREDCLMEIVCLEKKLKTSKEMYLEMRADTTSVLARSKNLWRRMGVYAKEKYPAVPADELMLKVALEKNELCRHDANQYELKRAELVKRLKQKPSDIIKIIAISNPYGIHYLLK